MASKRKKKATEKAPKKPLTFSKKIVIWAMIASTFALLMPYVLAWFQRDPVESLSATIITTCAGCIIAYVVKSLGEKMSRNKYHLDENGNPINQDNADEGRG